MKVVSIPEDHMKNVCLFRKGEATCRYLQYGDRNGTDTEELDSGWGCAKPRKESKAAVDMSAFSRVARGDNCSGPPDFQERHRTPDRRPARDTIIVI